jgi:hypothetical protein
MGTRNLFTIILNGKKVLAKYNQWDGYLKGQGKDLAEFIVNDLSFESLYNGITRIKLLNKNDSKIDAIYEAMNTCNDFDKKMNYPLITRDTNIKDQLRAISIGVGDLFSVDASSFINDGLFCEYAYELNLDDNTISVFKSGAKKCNKLVFKCDILEYPETLDKYIELNKKV